MIMVLIHAKMRSLIIFDGMGKKEEKRETNEKQDGDMKELKQNKIALLDLKMRAYNLI